MQSWVKCEFYQGLLEINSYHKCVQIISRHKARPSIGERYLCQAGYFEKKIFKGRKFIIHKGFLARARWDPIDSGCFEWHREEGLGLYHGMGWHQSIARFGLAFARLECSTEPKEGPCICFRWSNIKTLGHNLFHWPFSAMWESHQLLTPEIKGTFLQSQCR